LGGVLWYGWEAEEKETHLLLYLYLYKILFVSKERPSNISSI